MIKVLGSFTGIRISIATIKAFADSLNIPTVGVTSLESLAYNLDEEGLICSLIDAKHSNVYYSLFKLENYNYAEIEEATSSTVSDVLSSLSKYNEKITFVGDGSKVYEDEIKENIVNCEISKTELNAYSLGKAGYVKFLKTSSSEEILPAYLKRPQAEIQLEEKEKCK